eukprot:scpid14818/ scgid25503/ Endoplasmin; 94 kDa glucose-regulated protein; Heat shock protein 90 kDa beta member 1
MKTVLLLGVFALLLLSGASLCRADDDSDSEEAAPTVEEDLGKSKDSSKTDDEVVQREEEAIKLDGLNVSQMKELREGAEKHAFEAEVNRMMKLIINSLYRNKEIFLRELISNSSDALDKIRFQSLTDKNVLGTTEELSIKIKADKDTHSLHITDTGIGMTKEDLVKNLGTIAKSGTSEFLGKMSESSDVTVQSDLIGQFGVGFYSAFLVADRVIVTSKHNDDKQYIWESDADQFTVSEDPRGETLGRGTTVSLFLKEEAYDFVEQDTLKDLIRKYSQFINFPIFLWTSKTIEVEEPIIEDEDETPATADSDEEGSVEEAKKEDSPKTEKVEKTVWDWEKMNASKPLWTRNPRDVSDEEYTNFYKSFTKDKEEQGAHMHFVAEGEVSFRSVLFIPKDAPRDYDSHSRDPISRNIKLYVRRVFITDELTDLMPKYLEFIRGVVDSDDLPLNVSRENLQQHKLLKVIRKKLVRKILEMVKKMDADLYKDFWKEFGTSLKLGIIEDHSNRTRLAKLVRFHSSDSAEEMTSLMDYVERMKDKQEHMYYMAAGTREEAASSPFVESLLKKGYEVIYLTEPVDEYCIQSIPEFEGKKFQNVAKDGLTIGDETDKAKKANEALEKRFEPLTKWLAETSLKDNIEKAVISKRLADSPVALVANQWGWSGNMERIMRAQASNARGQDDFYMNQKKIMEINPRHPVIKKLLSSVEEDPNDAKARDLAVVLYESAVLRSGFALKDTNAFVGRIEKMLRLSLDVGLDEQVEEEAEPEEDDDEEPVEEEAAEEEESSDAGAEEPAFNPQDGVDEVLKEAEMAVEKDEL